MPKRVHLKCYFSCNDNSQLKNVPFEITYHRFPSDLQIKKLWMDFCNLDEKKDNVSNIYICSLHFQSSDYKNLNGKRVGGRLRLKKDVVPSILVPREKRRNISILVEESSPFSCQISEFVPTTSIVDPDCDGSKEWQCELCGEGFKARRAFRAHMLTHTKDKPYVCPICGKGFFDGSDLKPHMATHSEEYPFECDQCDMKFKIKWTLTEHSWTHEDKEYQCQICLKNLKSRKSIRMHLKLHTQTEGEGQNEKHSCDQCGKTYKHPNGLKCHKRRHTNDMFKCHVCDKLCLTRSYLRIHLRTHTGEKPFECEVCNEKFISISRLHSHRNKHDGYRKTYKCDSCDKVLMSKESLRNHQTVKHQPDPPDEKHQCKLCEKMFKLPMMLMRHLRKCHSDSIEGKQAYHNEQNQYAPFKCHICDKSYSRKLYLDVHLKLHAEGVNPYKCDTCGKEFGKKKMLDCHEKTHQNTEKTYKCDLCNKVYLIEGRLRRHKKEKHPMENQCKSCGKEFETELKAADHICNLKKEQESLDIESKVSICEICHADCSAEGLEAHISTHDVKPFKCECFAVFFSESDYKKHVKDDCEAVKSGLKLVDEVKVENVVKEELEIGFEGVKQECVG